MPRYFFDVVNSIGFVRDDEGAELADEQAARANAIVSIRSLLADDARQGRIDLRGRLEVRDEAGPVFIMAFADATEVLTGDLPPGPGPGAQP